MKLFLIAGLLNVAFIANSQQKTILDSSVNRFLSPFGHRDPNIAFKEFSILANNDILYTADSLKNKTTFINFWFEGCLPCLAEFDALKNLNEKFKSKINFQFLSFTSESQETLLRITKKYNLNYPILSLNSDSIHKLIFDLGFPTSMVIDKYGKVRFIVCGGFQEKEKAKERIESIYYKEIERVLNE